MAWKRTQDLSGTNGPDKFKDMRAEVVYRDNKMTTKMKCKLDKEYARLIRGSQPKHKQRDLYIRDVYYRAS